MPANDLPKEPVQHVQRPTGPLVAARLPTGLPRRAPGVRRSRRPLWSAIVFLLLISGVGIRAYRDLSRPEGWAYWKEYYASSSTMSARPGDLHGERVLSISGRIGASSASWFRDRLDEIEMPAGSLVLLSSPGGDLNQAMIMGELIRSRGLNTAVGTLEASDRISPSYCASACVLAYAGGKSRIGIEGSELGVHRFVTTTSGQDPVAETQRTAGVILGYMTKMGVSPAIVEAMSETRDVHWLGTENALDMHLITTRAETSPATPHH